MGGDGMNSGARPSYEEELSLALALCDRADQLSTASFERGPVVTFKPDGTPVTEADVAIETMIREALEDSFPEDAILGEEFGSQGDSPRQWIVDPIDGTKNFAAGIPLWSTLIGLRVEGRFTLGAMSVPGVRERLWAAEGVGAFQNGTPLSVSETGEIPAAMVLFGDLEGILGTPEEAPFGRLVKGARRSRGFGDSWGYGLVASGRAEAMIEPWAAIWDVAGPAAIVEIAGGRITQFDGSPLEHGGSVLATNGYVHDACIQELRSQGVNAR